MRTLALALPTLGLDLWRREEPALGQRPAALTERRGARAWVVQASAAAAARGAASGTPLAEAAARVPDLATRERDPAREALALEALADALYQRLSPRVAGVADPDSHEADALLVDLTGTERLLPDERAVLALAAEAAAERGLTARLALADPPAAALALARHAPRAPACLARGLDEAALRAALGPLPPACLDLDRRTARRLRALGVERLEHLWSLPPRSLPSRLGDDLLRRLDALLGRRELDLRWRQPGEPVEVALRFDAAPLVRLGDLQQAAALLAAELAVQLDARDLGARALTLELERADSEPSLHPLALAASTREGPRLARLLGAALAQAPPPGVCAVDPVVAGRLRAVETERQLLRQRSLFGDDDDRRRAQADLDELLTRLELSLGAERVARLAPGGDPRPERALLAVAVGAPLPEAPALPLRPLRLLSPPRALAVEPGEGGAPGLVREGGLPWRPLAVRGPERIEAAWWEPAPARRDYYVVLAPGGRALWLFRDLAAEGPAFFLHGVFA